MQFAMVGLGRMGANLAQRLMRAGHDCVAFDPDETARRGVAHAGATLADDLAALVNSLQRPRVVWLMVPAAHVAELIAELTPLLSSGDVIVDGGNSHYQDDVRRAAALEPLGIHLVDVGTSGGVHGLERGYCLMAGGSAEAVALVEPLLRDLAPGFGEIPRTPGRDGEAAPEELGYLHCGASGAGHYVKMVHNGIEYGMMAALAEGLNLLAHANDGAVEREASAEVAPLPHPEMFQYPFDSSRVTELWRRGSVVSSWLLDLTAAALHEDPQLAGYSGNVSDSGEGRWTVQAAVEVGVPVPVLAASLFSRFSSRQEDRFAHQVLSAMRSQFGGHAERPASEDPAA